MLSLHPLELFFFSTWRLNDNHTFIIWNFSLKPRYHISLLLTDDACDDDPGGQHFWSAPSSSLIYKHTIGIVEGACWNSWRTGQGLPYRICCVCDGCDSETHADSQQYSLSIWMHLLLWHCAPSWGWQMPHSEPSGEGVRLISHQNTLQDTHKACWSYNNCMTIAPHAIPEV